MDDDDDFPPPLSSFEEQIHAITLGAPRTLLLEGEDSDANLPIAATTVVGGQTYGKEVEAKAAATVIKRGFFDSKSKSKPSPAAKAPQAKKGNDAEVIVLKGKTDQIRNGGPSIPDFLRVEPDEQMKRLQEVKGKLVNALQPTPEMISKLGKDPTLLSGFEDPEVMAAVDEIAKDPTKMLKHQNNKKVQEFYRAMAMFAGGQLEQMENMPL